jgi:hypothetical protein
MYNLFYQLNLLIDSKNKFIYYTYLIIQLIGFSFSLSFYLIETIIWIQYNKHSCIYIKANMYVTLDDVINTL